MFKTQQYWGFIFAFNMLVDYVFYMVSSQQIELVGALYLVSSRDDGCKDFEL